MAVVDSPRSSPIFYRNQRRQYPVIDRGEGVFLWDREGKRYLDMMGGVAVVSIGHAVPEVIEAMSRQAERVSFAYGNHFTSEAALGLAARVVELAPPGLEKVFFVSGGSEATESALKLARQYFMEIGKTSKYKVIGRWGSFHGNTMGSLSMGGRVGWQEMYGPLLLDFPHISASYCYRCPLGKCYPACDVACADDLERAIVAAGAETVAAFIADPIVGSTLGAAAPPPEYFRRIREICDTYDVLFIADEVITGFGRTGRNFGIDHWDVIPDMIACGKGISSGYVPLGALVVHERIADAIHHGSGAIMHGHTYGGNPQSCAIGLAVQDYVREHHLIQRSAVLGRYLYERALRLLELPSVGDVRGGKGLFLGVEFVANKATRTPFPREVRFGETLLETGLEHGVTLYAGTGGADGRIGDCIILAPPFVIDEEQIDRGIELLEASIVETEARVGATRTGPVVC
jgi:adenosylmethionine-8-amino-7-oxononanoate aminotransferase